MKNLILGSVSKLSFSKIELFFLSRAKNCADNDCVIFVHDVSDIVRNRLECLGVILIDVDKVLDVSEHIKESRWLLFEKYLRDHKDEYEQVFICDIRDVIFERDIFEIYSDKSFICLAEELGEFGKSDFYDELVIAQYGENNFDNYFLKNKIICSGTILGTADEMWKLTKTMVNIMFGGMFPNFKRSDQSAFNYSIYAGMLPDSVKCYSKPLSGNIVTIGTASEYDINEMEHILENENIRIVHQYDRWPELIKRYRLKYKKANYLLDKDYNGIRNYIDLAYISARNGDLANTYLYLNKTRNDLLDYSETMKYIKWSKICWNDVLPIYQAVRIVEKDYTKDVMEIENILIEVLSKIPVGNMMIEDFVTLSDLLEYIDRNAFRDFYETIQRVYMSFLQRGDAGRVQIMKDFGLESLAN